MSKKKILILCRRDDRMEYDRRQTMLAGMAAIDAPADYYGADYEDLIFDYDGQKLQVIDTKSGADVADFDVIFLIGWFKSKSLDDIARAVAHYADFHHIPFANSEAFHGRSFTKLSQCVIAALNGVSVTPFLFSLDGEVLLEAARTTKIEFPYIAKAVAASRGQDNHLIQSHEQLEAVIHTPVDPAEPPKHFIIQQFIPNDGDYRILVMGGKVRLVIHRQSQSESHLNNTSQGGKATMVDLASLPEKVLSDSVRLSALLRREVTGVDMVAHRESGEYYFLEANNMPQLATGSYVPEKMTALSEYLVELADGKVSRYLD